MGSRFLAAIVETAEDAIFAKALDGEILSWNAAAQRMYGYTPDEIVGQSVHRLASPDHHAEIDDILRRIARGERIEHFETERVRKNGEHFPVSLSISPVKDATGRIAGAATIARDISEQRLLAGAIAAQNAELRAVVDAIGEAALICGPDGRIRLRNPAAEQLLPGVEDFDGILRALGPPVAEPGANIDGAAPTGVDSASFELTVDGVTRSVRLATRPILPAAAVSRDRNGERPHELGTIVLLTDLTEIRDIEVSRDAFVGVLSHELRTPVTTIYAGARMLRRRGNDGEARGLLQDIESESDRLYRLIEDLLVLTKVERGTLAIADEPILLRPIIASVVASEKARRGGAEVDIAVDQLPTVHGEDTYVEQVLRNLVSNALKYAPVDSTVRIEGEADAESVRLRVLDSGPGIEPADRERVFDLLYRAPATETRASGAGIGLYVCRRLMEAMGGQIWMAPRPGGGSEFGIEFRRYEEMP
jgi:PAS domain S-box-containing protein